MKSAVLYLTNRDCAETLSRFQAVDLPGDRFIAYESDLGLRFPEDVATWPFTVRRLPYRCLSPRVVPGSTAYMVADFQIRHDYDFVWFVEDDVRFLGSWSTVAAAAPPEADFIGVEVRAPDERWPWLGSFVPPVDWDPRPEDILKSLFCVSRLSRHASLLIDRIMRDGCMGHHELVVPTVLRRAGMVLTDWRSLGLLDHERFRWSPPLTPAEIDGAAAGRFIHPVKFDSQTRMCYHPLSRRDKFRVALARLRRKLRRKMGLMPVVPIPQRT